MAHLQPRDELGVDEGICQQYFCPLAFPEGQGACLDCFIGAIQDSRSVIAGQPGAVARQGRERLAPFCWNRIWIR